VRLVAFVERGCVDGIEHALDRRDVVRAWLDVSKMSRLSWAPAGVSRWDSRGSGSWPVRRGCAGAIEDAANQPDGVRAWLDGAKMSGLS
ncbi:MAG TPA: hypothetical protein VFM55_04420, partial [Micromonosporaceae bacterium]|nr:hypothetical protein [Micromonosporaceae bacterium]